MIRVSLEMLVMGNVPGTSILLLRPVASEPFHDKILPICVGPVEAAAIGKGLSNEKSSRPITHSLLLTVMGALGGALEQVSINKVNGTIFYATLHIKQGDKTIEVDARPSDAIALAVRLHTPIYVSRRVIEVAGFPAWVNGQDGHHQVEIEQFHEFVENLTPEDFSTQTLRTNDASGD